MGEEFSRAMRHQYEKENKWYKKHPKDKEHLWKIKTALFLVAALALFLDFKFTIAIWVLLLAYYVFDRCK